MLFAALAPSASAAPPLDVTALVLGFVAGLALFLFGVQLLADALRRADGGRLQAVLARASAKRVSSLGSGTAATVLLDSSSVAIILLIAVVDAGLVPLARALPAVLGANIGTTVSSQVFAWNIDEWAPVLLAAGLGWRALARSDGGRDRATMVLGFGLVLYGLHVIGVAAEPLGEQRAVIDWLARLENPLLGVLAGAVATVAIQSSSAMMGIVITLAGTGLISLPAGIAIMLGAEIGTCADTLLATIGRSRAAVKTGLFHLGFNIASVAVGVALIGLLVAAARALGGDVGQQIANAHVLFNVVGALAMLPFTGVAARLLDRLVPERDDRSSASASAVVTASG